MAVALVDQTIAASRLAQPTQVRDCRSLLDGLLVGLRAPLARLRVNRRLAVLGDDGSKTWEPPIGVRFRTPGDGSRWHTQVYTEVGGFSVGSCFAWQAFPTVGVKRSKLGSLECGDRWLDLDYGSGEHATLCRHEVIRQGPVVRVAYRFG
jgi:hypothetical protein